jgi:uncharacterized Zn finger protein
VEGLIALAKFRRKHHEVLAIKERFSDRNAIYLKEVLSYHEKNKNWNDAVRIALAGIERFGHHNEFMKSLIRAHDGLGNPLAAQEVQTERFMENPDASEWKELKKRSESLGNWNAVYRKLLGRSPTRIGRCTEALRPRLLLAEGKERELLKDAVSGEARMDLETTKLIA